MSRFARWAGLLLTLACSQLPPSFEEVPLETARELLGDPRISLIDAVAGQAAEGSALPGGFRWDLGEGSEPAPRGLPTGGVLVVASNRPTAHRSAAALARAGNHPVLVFIPRNAEERSSLYALALQTEEKIRGENS
jgi:hypothetical protein